uniref:Uncharacterized protein n=1 Tax=Leersia perrieri TaxID=77586 RepID=A0A0D9WAJ1_9ORYZ
MVFLSFDGGDQVVVASTFKLGEDILGRTELIIFPYLVPYIQEVNEAVYLSKPTPGVVGEVTRVVADEVVPETAVCLHEPLSGVDNAMIRQTPLLLLPGAFHRRGVAVQPQLLLELAFDAFVSIATEHLLQ